jgi:hypothetical protein
LNAVLSAIWNALPGLLFDPGPSSTAFGGTFTKPGPVYARKFAPEKMAAANERTNKMKVRFIFAIGFSTPIC